MKDFKKKVAVIAEAASGIRLGLTKHYVKKGIKTVLSDIEEELLLKVTNDLRDAGGDVISIITDESSLEEIKYLPD